MNRGSWKMRPYRGAADRQRMIDLVSGSPDRTVHGSDLPYRFSSPALQSPDAVRLWEDPSGQLLGWAIWQAPFGVLDYVSSPDAGLDLERAILTWGQALFRQIAYERGRPLPYWVMARDDDARRISLLESEGFRRADWFHTEMEVSLDARLPECVPPPSFRIRSLAGEREVPAYVALHRAAFGTSNMTVEFRGRTLQAPEYLPDLDLMAEAPDGRMAAFCVGWMSARIRPSDLPRQAQIEPMGVHPEFRRLGLGKAVIAAQLQQMKAHGASRATVIADYGEAATGVYQSVGFRALRRQYAYFKEF